MIDEARKTLRLLQGTFKGVSPEGFSNDSIDHIRRAIWQDGTYSSIERVVMTAAYNRQLIDGFVDGELTLREGRATAGTFFNILSEPDGKFSANGAFPSMAVFPSEPNQLAQVRSGQITLFEESLDGGNRSWNEVSAVQVQPGKDEPKFLVAIDGHRLELTGRTGDELLLAVLTHPELTGQYVLSNGRLMRASAVKVPEQISLYAQVLGLGPLMIRSHDASNGSVRVGYQFGENGSLVAEYDAGASEPSSVAATVQLDGRPLEVPLAVLDRALADGLDTFSGYQSLVLPGSISPIEGYRFGDQTIWWAPAISSIIEG